MSRFGVIHATCGHAVAVTPDRLRAERLRDGLHMVGYHRFRVRRLDSDAEIEAAVTGLVESDPQSGGCLTCRVDPSRAALLAPGGAS